MADKWKRVRLGDAATFVNGMAFKPTDWDTTGLPIIRIQNLTEGRSEIHYFSGSCPEKYLVNQGDVLISWSATLGVYIWNNEKAVLNQHIFKVVFDKLEFDKRYFVYIVGQKINEMSQNTHGSTMKHIIKKYFDAIEIPLPPLDEQKRIADVLDKASELIKKRKEQIRLMDELAKSLFIEMFGDPVENPMGWGLCKFSDMGEIKRGLSKHRPRDDPILLGGIYPLIQTGNVANSGLYIEKYWQTYSEIGLKQSKLWEKGTLCITIAANIAKTAILSFDSCFPDSIVGFLPNNKTNNIFIHYWFSFFQEILERQAPESAQKNINLKILNELKIINPPISLQQEFADRITVIEQQKALLQNGLAKMETAYKALMQEYFG